MGVAHGADTASPLHGGDVVRSQEVGRIVTELKTAATTAEGVLDALVDERESGGPGRGQLHRHATHGIDDRAGGGLGALGRSRQ